MDRAALALDASKVADAAFKMLSKFAETEACRRIAHGKILGREVPFTAPGTDGATLVGRIDLLLEEPGTIWVIDYKTGVEPLEGYASQMQAYVDALRANGVAARPALVSIRTGEWMSLEG